MHLTWNLWKLFWALISKYTARGNQILCDGSMFYVLRGYFCVYFDSFTLCLALPFKIVSEWLRHAKLIEGHAIDYRYKLGDI
jgi:hypothetical protein